MNAKQKGILAAILSKPTRANILWSDIEKLIISLGGQIREGKGSAGVFILKGSVFPFHRPHPQKEAKRYQVELLRKFLLSKEAGL
ncbi:type II toxin-antitoxin system HicA family toxin [Rickettsiales endosymbiont of Peranema trichophorum]|uniref:type II toxin-antitoxin system HicA family toxin n=1 Tax=Rickettsiales endosymbiont of Peranema trichophorum TaxID=2486577 RepID=UPI001023F0A6|nr:type II toxin-antitoxin system HicA family toxin [Rickettsiales endosymbiont of Peranema trichophorum]RZI47648.1 type II toxin-antitoxin system HicA family toxin [Rickettsiales endosymbiont of Peranema trichophorum]